MNAKRVQVIISGYVQGVAFRASCQRQARAYGVTGWVRNRWDGSVEALFEGPADSVDAMVQWCQHGPPAAMVADVEVSEALPGESFRSFSIRP
jgi:acylphosphatase